VIGRVGPPTAALDARPSVPLYDLESPEWMSREIFGHFAHWTEWGIARLDIQLAGDEPPTISITAEEPDTLWAAEDRAARYGLRPSAVTNPAQPLMYWTNASESPSLRR
jgi:hypothetical protein